MVGSAQVRQVLRRRLAQQRLVGDGLASAADVVRLLTCVQSQEYAHAFWSVGMRTNGLTFAEVRQEFDSGGFLRTHILRPTWHFVAPDDIRWILQLASPRVQQQNASRYRELGLSQADLDRGSQLMVGALSERNFLTRRELGAVLTEHGMSVEGQRLAHLVMNAELEARICSGPIRGAQHTYAVLDERVAPSRPRSDDDTLAELTLRFFEGHGPARLADFTRWSSLRTSQARIGLELVRHRLERVDCLDQTMWCTPSATEPPSYPEVALLAPLYDEVTLSYSEINFEVAAGHPHPPGMDLFIGSVIVEETNVGTWRRTVKAKKVTVETQLTPQLSSSQRSAVAEAVLRLADFLELELETAG